MIKMTRLRLINWHNFQDDTIDFKNITYLLGVNAVGKTTITASVEGYKPDTVSYDIEVVAATEG